MRRPWLPLYAADFLASPKVRRMTLEERGAYLTLLLDSWVTGGLAPDSLGDRLGIDQPDVERLMAGVLGRCWDLGEDGLLRNPRLEQERTKAEALSERRAAAGAKGGRARGPQAKGLDGNPPSELPPAQTSVHPSNSKQQQAIAKHQQAIAKPPAVLCCDVLCSEGESEGEGFPWPDWMPVAKRDIWVQDLDARCFGLVDVRSSAVYLDGLRQALCQVMAPRPNESAIDGRIRAEKNPVDEVARWLERLDGRGPAYVTTALRGGPASALWQHPRFAQEARRGA